MLLCANVNVSSWEDPKTDRPNSVKTLNNKKAIAGFVKLSKTFPFHYV